MNASAVLHASLLNSYIYPAENQFLSLSQAVLEHLDPAKFPLPEPFPYKVRCLRIHPVTRQAYTLVCMHSSCSIVEGFGITAAMASSRRWETEFCL